MSNLKWAIWSSSMKFNRARDSILFLESWIKENNKESELTTLFDKEQDVEILKLVVHGLPIDVSLIVGEIFHNLRGCLDYIATAVVEHQTGKKEGTVYFPFRKSKSGFLEEGRKHKIAKHAPHIWKIIEEEFRPYSDQDGDSVLWSIQKLNNEDKHRLLIVTNSAGAAVGDHQSYGHHGMVSGQSNTFTRVGAGEFEIARGFQIAHRMEIYTSVVISEPEIVGTVELIPYLRECLNRVERVGNTLQPAIFQLENNIG